VVRFSALCVLYVRRLRVHAVQESWAGFGIAVGVGLVFAVQVANGSITASAKGILHRITGEAQLQLAARDPGGFDQRLVVRVRGLAGVERAAPVFEQRATVAYRGRRVAVDFVGIDRTLPSLGGLSVGNVLVAGLSSTRRVVLPAAMARALGVPDSRGSWSPSVVVEMRGRSARVPVGAVAGPELIGSALANAMLAGAAMPVAQQLAGLRGRITRIFVVAKAGREAQVRAGLERLAAGRLTVTDVDADSRMLDEATAPNDQATNLTAFISGLVGLLLTFNAMLLTMPERRQLVADLRIQGFRSSKLLQVLGFQAIVLGAVASLAGLGVGWLLVQSTANNAPGYLALAFPLGVERVIHWQTIVLTLAGGIAATCLAAAQPLLDLRRGRAVDAVYLEEITEPGNALSTRTRWLLAVSALALVAVSSLLLFLVPELTVIGLVALAFATLFALPAVSLLILKAAEVPAAGWRMNMLILATRALRATTLRSLALAAMGAVAIFGSIAVESAHRNLLHGLYQDYHQYVSSADLWISHRADDLALQPFDDHGFSTRVRHVAGVASVHSYYGGLLDIAARRTWIIARPSSDEPLIPPSQILDGNPSSASAHLRAGGWVVVSQQIADAQQHKIGETITLPTPTGNHAYRIAATTTNLGWGPGAIILNSRDYRHAWASRTPTALEVSLTPGADPIATKRAIERALGPDAALQVQTTAEREQHADALARAGLARLSQISLLLLIAAGLAMAAAMSTAIWQRRPILAQLRIQGSRPPKLRRALLLETTIVLLAACLTGTTTGLYGHYLLDRWLQTSTGYPAPYTPATTTALTICLLVSSFAILAATTTSHLAAKAPTHLALES
jgi:putative ABC transport system permease protein